MIVEADKVINQSFDYVVVGKSPYFSLPICLQHEFVLSGGGTAGLIVAARLTEDPRVTVLVLEGGPANIDDPNISKYKHCRYIVICVNISMLIPL